MSESEEAIPLENSTTSDEPFTMERAQQQIQEAEGVESKLQLTIYCMERALAQTGAPQFKSFWELRKTALELFKESINPIVRAQLWSSYTELTKEARRLKEILDEQSAFAVEQIEIAIQAIEEGLENFSARLENAPEINLGADSTTLQPRYPYYLATQKELALLNAEASHINAMRKEIIKIEMRIRQKNRFFQRLSAAGDRVFPRRKDLIKEISDHFVSDIASFIENFFSVEDLSESLFFLREEIKALQTIAKILTLNTRSFTETRTRLSEGWDRIKATEKERKKERSKKRVLFRQNADLLLSKIEEVIERADAISCEEATNRLDALFEQMRSTELGREELQELRQKLQEAYEPIQSRAKEEEQRRRDKLQEREAIRRAKIAELQLQADALLRDDADLSIESIEAERATITALATGKEVTKSERQELERKLKRIRDLIADKRAQALLNLSQDDQQTLSKLYDILKERISLKQEIKSQLEQYRRLLGGSGLDFEQAIRISEQQALEKERLAKTDLSIYEIQEKIEQLEARSS